VSAEHKVLQAEPFDRLYRSDPDPWSFRTSWYEQRKRDLLLACLPLARFRSGYEPACANGEISARLASRVDELLCSDFSLEAVALARQRLQSLSNVRVVQQALPEEWPRAEFDLIVFGELGYYFTPTAWQRTCQQAAASLADDGVLVACHWRHPVEGASLTGDQVHDTLTQVLGTPPGIRHLEEDFRLELWFGGSST